ncbi:hypothetical protein C5E07_00460 [Pseudoclavibacter sp. RFBJ3]|uniref:DUF1684 domain-containing protein n=1 Tax=unclassified Pseudoclavibacter TaxID=2615177 RepID=UPI000CE88701|nr:MULTISPECIES: DUF1684 domain-containing protein [unclassified Pseudoclavibacter]PPF86453.1 hypothetical protein C5C12_01670 [Pseudoclavibacter sp. RFBJ5]PPF95185.1 hypothetical protein C5E07_00460 [Pseudoclavibacter sp. RFBJ3]PPF97620.1 hypothetical protein C5C19_11140 [Pseudoclavibacter sp. RFBH5]PPG22726.1 hypothetical protein C5E13_10800 [Pseudoclavibacter sp. RFBI4]
MSISASPSLVRDVDRDQFTRDWEAWHVEHEKRRTDGHGFLAVTSLNFLSEQPQAIDGIPGSWSLEDGQAIVDLADGETLEADGLLLQGPRLHRFPCIAERDGVTARAGRVLIEIAKRGGFTIVRPRDPDYDYLAAYSGTPTYLPNPRWRAQGTFEAFDEPRDVTVGAAVEGLEHVYSSPGKVTFELRGEQFSLTAFNGHEAGSLLVLFTDATSGLTTYAANRALSVSAPDAEGRVTVDFNRAVNLPCAYTVFATCPLPPAENRLPVGIEAGEKTPLAKAGEHAESASA